MGMGNNSEEKPQSNATEIICIIDKSGSMQTIKSDAIGGFNAYIEEQKKEEGEASVSLIFFSTSYDPAYYNKPLKDVESLNESVYVPSGGTALLDALGRTLNEAMTREESEPKGTKHLVVILTDGEENASREYTNEAIAKIIGTLREKGNWEFIYLGANQDAFSVARNIGVSTANSLNFTADSESVNILYKKMSKASSMYRSAGVHEATMDIMSKASDEVDEELKNEKNKVMK